MARMWAWHGVVGQERAIVVQLAIVVCMATACNQPVSAGVATTLPEPSPTAAVQSRIARIGYLSEGTGVVGPSEEAFLQGLRELGNVDGQNVIIEYRHTQGRADLARQYAQELAEIPVDVIVAVGNLRVQAAKEATNTIPIVMTNSGDPVAAGFVNSIAVPGTNVTGMSGLSPGLAGKRLQVLKGAAPSIRRVAILANPSNANTVQNWRETQAAAAVAGIELLYFEVGDEPSLQQAFELIAQQDADALIPLGDAFFFLMRNQIAAFATEHHMATIYDLRDFAVAGGLLAYGPSFPALFKRSASHVDRILKGADPAVLPVEQPVTFDFILNLSTADALGLTIAPDTLAQATEVVR